MTRSADSANKTKEKAKETAEKTQKTIHIIAEKLKDKQRRLDEWRAP